MTGSKNVPSPPLRTMKMPARAAREIRVPDRVDRDNRLRAEVDKGATLVGNDNGWGRTDSEMGCAFGQTGSGGFD